MKQMLFYYKNSLIMMIMLMLMIMLSVAFLTLMERKMMGNFHYRKGPNKNSLMGLLQPFNDAMKLLSKENILNMKSNFYMFMFSPMMLLMNTMFLWILYPFFTNLINLKMSMLLLISMLTMTVYGLMFMGWSSNSTFSMISSIRSTAQSISYEVIFSINLLILLNFNNSINFLNLNILQNYLPMIMMNFLISIILLMSMMAEINRTPFDLSESESELISGFNIEFASSLFTMIFLAEYASMLFMSMFFIYINMYINPLNIMFYMLCIMMIFMITWIRMTFPRLRYDKLMYLCWFYFLPMILILFIWMMMTLKMNLDFKMMN